MLYPTFVKFAAGPDTDDLQAVATLDASSRRHELIPMLYRPLLLMGAAQHLVTVDYL